MATSRTADASNDIVPRALRVLTILGAAVAVGWFAALATEVIDANAALGQSGDAAPGTGLLVRTAAALGVGLVLLGLRSLMTDWPRTCEVLLAIVSAALVIAALVFRDHAGSLGNPAALLAASITVAVGIAGLAITDLTRRLSD